MDSMNEQTTPDAPRPIETASATTSPTNSSSGPLAYILAALALLVCLAMGVAAKGCTSLVGEIVADEALNDHSIWDELGEDAPFHYDTDNGSGNTDRTDHTQEVSLVDVLDKDLALYGSIDAKVGALAYANVQLDVSQAVRDIVLIDRNATTELAGALRTAAADEDRADEALAEAKGHASDAIAQLEAYEVPRIDGEDADKITDEIKQGKDHAIKRWEAIQAELDALTAHRKPLLDEVEDADEDVAGATADAAEAFLEALSTARHL